MNDGGIENDKCVSPQKEAFDSETGSALTTVPLFFVSVTGLRVRARLQQDPKGGELCPVMVKPWETVVDASHITDVQIVCRSGA